VNGNKSGFQNEPLRHGLSRLGIAHKKSFAMHTPESVYGKGPWEVWYVRREHSVSHSHGEDFFKKLHDELERDQDKIRKENKLRLYDNVVRDESGNMYASINPNDLARTHIKIASIKVPDDVLADGEKRTLEWIWAKMQGESWSPKGDARDFIRCKGASHTSMSMGDLIVTPNGDVMMPKSTYGFKSIGKREDDPCPSDPKDSFGAKKKKRKGCK